MLPRDLKQLDETRGIVCTDLGRARLHGEMIPEACPSPDLLSIHRDSVVFHRGRGGVPNRYKFPRFVVHPPTKWEKTQTCAQKSTHQRTREGESERERDEAFRAAELRVQPHLRNVIVPFARTACGAAGYTCGNRSSDHPRTPHPVLLPAPVRVTGIFRLTE